MSLASALDLIERVSDLSVLFVGDTIIDEYDYVTVLGKSPKENLIPVRFFRKEVFAGGVVAAANHARSFCRIEVCSLGPVTRKVRFVDENYMRKLFEVHYSDGIAKDVEPDGNYDVTAITDFGHGAAIESRHFAGFVALSVQTNSANVGFNLITKYPRADYIVIDEPEARLAAADRDSPIADVIEKLARGRCNKFVVTHGHFGAYGWDGETLRHAPAVSDYAIDTMGAGDAFFAVTATMSKHGTMDDLLMIGNAAGALKTKIVGHRQSVTKENLIALLKEKHG